MRVRSTSDNRELIIRVLQDVAGEKAVYGPFPEFAVFVGGYTLGRDGWIYTGGAEDDETDPTLAAPDQAFAELARMALCEYPYAPEPPEEQDYPYTLQADSATVLMNITSIISARQRILNRALDARNAFYVAPKLMSDLLAHPPDTTAAFLQALYGREEEYRGITYTLEYAALPGFRKGRPDEAHIHRQLAEKIWNAAAARRWTKPFTPRTRNQKYVFRIWMNALGMTGPEYEEARRVLLGRLTGRSDRKKIPAGKED